VVAGAPVVALGVAVALSALVHPRADNRVLRVGEGVPGEGSGLREGDRPVRPWRDVEAARLHEEPVAHEGKQPSVLFLSSGSGQEWSRSA
jgi:hypothetical protein